MVDEKNRPSWNNEQVVQTDAETSAVHTSRWTLLGSTNWLFCWKSVGSELQGKRNLLSLVPSFCVNRGQRSRSQDRKRVHICRHNGNHMHEKNKFNFVSLFPILCLTLTAKRCAVCWLPRSVQGHIKCLGFLSFFSFLFNVCTSDILEVLRWYIYPSICIAGSNSEVNNSLYNGGKWSRTMSGYIALNAISFSVCRPHSALKVDTLHINWKKNTQEKYSHTQNRLSSLILLLGSTTSSLPWLFSLKMNFSS